jgi:hypothetical protein
MVSAGHFVALMQATDPTHKKLSLLNNVQLKPVD